MSPTKAELEQELTYLDSVLRQFKLLDNLIAVKLVRGCAGCTESADYSIELVTCSIGICDSCLDVLNCFLDEFGIGIEIISP